MCLPDSTLTTGLFVPFLLLLLIKCWLTQMRVNAFETRFLQLGFGPLRPFVTLGFPSNKGIFQNLPTFFAPLILPSFRSCRVTK